MPFFRTIMALLRIVPANLQVSFVDCLWFIVKMAYLNKALHVIYD